MRQYERTHPWIRFKADLSSAPFRLWLLLGEVQAKCELMRGTAVSPQVAQDLLAVYLAKGVHATTAIEGNTLTEAQVSAILAGQGDLPPSQQYQEQQVKNVIAAYNAVGNRILQGDIRSFSPGLLSEYNRLVLQDLVLEEEAVPADPRRILSSARLCLKVGRRCVSVHRICAARPG